MVDLIIQTVKPAVKESQNDKPWWMGNTSGQFTMKSAWEIIRKKKEKKEIMTIFGIRVYP